MADESRSLAKMREDHKNVLADLSKFQEKMQDEDFVPKASEAERMESLVEEAAGLQDEIERAEKLRKGVAGAIEGGKRIPSPTMPGEEPVEPEPVGDLIRAAKGGGPGQRRRITALDGKRAAGMMPLGTFVVASKGMRDYLDAGTPKGQFKLADVGSLFRAKRASGRGSAESSVFVPVSKDQLKRFYESKAVPTLGDDVIEPSLDPDFVRVTEHDQLRLRDVLNIVPTTSDAVKYTRLVSYTRAASTVANSAQKPEAAMELDTVTQAVRTIAVWIPVEEQQLSDLPALAGLINGELLYDVDKHLEEQVAYGDGTGENFDGILNDAAVAAAREESGDTLIDVVRRGITDVRRAGYSPNGVTIDPLDWESVVLEKGSDNRYVWVVVTDGATQRLWAVPVIETEAMEDYAGVTTEARNLVVGDWARGATLYDREQSSVSVGWINDQFIHNQRTILAEMRAAFGVKRPGAFRKHETQAASSS